jgi:hypothetical protein
MMTGRMAASFHKASRKQQWYGGLCPKLLGVWPRVAQRNRRTKHAQTRSNIAAELSDLG